MLRVVILAAALASPAAAQSMFQPILPMQPIQPMQMAPMQPAPRTTYDWRSGNVYSTTPRSDGSTTVRGFNSNNGTTWNTTIQPNGTQTGTDSRGNMWRQSPNGFYQNYGTGRVCTGTGYGRVCN